MEDTRFTSSDLVDISHVSLSTTHVSDYKNKSLSFKKEVGTYELYLPDSLPSTALLETPPHPVEDWEVGFRYARFTRLSADRALGSDRTLVEGMLLVGGFTD